MQIELRSLQQSLGITFIFVTHDQEEAITLSDRIAVMSEGKALQIGSPKDLYNTPVSVEVADFIGQMNFVDAEVLDVKSGVAVIDTSGLGKVKIPTSADFAQKGARGVVAIRPEKLKISEKKSGALKNAVEGTLKSASYYGNRSHYHVTVEGSDQPMAVASQEVDIASGNTLDSDTPVWLSWEDGALILLPQPPA